MSVTMQNVLRVLDAFEPDYTVGAKLGPESLPHLAVLARGADALLAEKAVYLASLIGTDGGTEVLHAAMNSASPGVRLQAAAGARNLAPDVAATLLAGLLGDADRGVRKFALRSAKSLFTTTTMPPTLRARIAALGEGDPEPFIRRFAASMST